MDRLNPLDALFVDAEDEDRHTSMAIGSIAIFEGPVPSYDDVLVHIAGRLPLLPRYRQRLRTVPLRLGRPVWSDDPCFDIRYHVRRTALPAPGGDQQLSELMAHVMAARLDRDFPLWEYWLVEGLADGRWALISKVHHCMADGIAASDMYRVICAPTPGPSPPVPDERTVGREPSSLGLATRAALSMALLPIREAAALRGAVASPGRAIRWTAGTLRAIAKLTPALWPAPRSSLSGPIGQPRRYTWTRAPLDDARAIKRELGGTVNDVFLAAISGGFRDLLLARGEQPGPRTVPSLVPVSVRALGEENIYENRISAIVAHLPVHLADPVDRLSAVRAELAGLKTSKEAILGQEAVWIGDVIPFPVISRGSRLLFSLPQREIVTVTTDVPGPRDPLYAAGRRLVEIIPYVPIASTLRIGVAVFSYCGNVTFGVTGDFAANPDIDVLARGIERGMSDLLEAAQRHSRPVSSHQSRTGWPGRTTSC